MLKYNKHTINHWKRPDWDGMGTLLRDRTGVEEDTDNKVFTFFSSPLIYMIFRSQIDINQQSNHFFEKFCHLDTLNSDLFIPSQNADYKKLNEAKFKFKYTF